jgi:single-strand DNA-binding protein
LGGHGACRRAAHLHPQGQPESKDFIMRGINHVFLVGHVGQNPELRTTANGRTLCRFSLATNRPVKHGEGWKQETDWHRIVLWERDAELAVRYATKGSPVGIEGELRTSSWTDQAGVRQSRIEVVGRKLHLLSKGRTAEDRTPTDLPLKEASSGTNGMDTSAIPF